MQEQSFIMHDSFLMEQGFADCICMFPFLILLSFLYPHLPQRINGLSGPNLRLYLLQSVCVFLCFF